MKQIQIKECVTPEELTKCVDLQRAVFKLPDIEISPMRHLVVTRHAGGFVLGAFDANRLVGFVLSVPGFHRGEPMFYSHMTAIDADYQNYGIGARLKWAQRERALTEDVSFIKWTFQPEQARNAHFNLEKLGAFVTEYKPNFYGFDYGASNNPKFGIPSDRLFAEWELLSPKVKALSRGENRAEIGEPILTIDAITNWNFLLENNPELAIAEQARIRGEFQNAFSNNMVCRGFLRDEPQAKYLLFSA